MSTKFIEGVTLEAINCCNCGVTFAMPETWLDTFRKDPARTFYCPAGHGNVFRKSIEQRLRDELERKNRELADAERQTKMLAGDLRSQKFKTQSAQMHAAKLKKRIKNGVCPCCQRTFKNLAEHISHMHPEFAQ
jgi:hypothetical protein